MLHFHSTVSASGQEHRALRRVLVVVAIASLLSGCAIWPKSLSLPFFGGSQAEAPVVTPAETAPVAPPPAPVQPTVAVVPPAPVAVPAPVSEAPKTETTLIAGVPADSMSPATKASLGVTTPAASTAAAKSAAAPPAGGELAPGFYINVGLFAVPSNGVNAHKKLEAAGMPVFSDGIVNKKGPLTRVRVGPFASKALAQAAAQKIQAMKLEAVVFQK